MWYRCASKMLSLWIWHLHRQKGIYRIETAYEVDRKTKFRYYLRIFFDLTVSCVVIYENVIYEKKVNSKINLFAFQVMLAESLFNQFFHENVNLLLMGLSSQLNYLYLWNILTILYNFWRNDSDVSTILTMEKRIPNASQIANLQCFFVCSKR